MNPTRILFLLAGGLAALMVAGTAPAIAAPKKPSKGAKSKRAPAPSKRPTPPPSQTDDAPATGSETVTGELLALRTDKNGKIRQITLRTDAGRKAFDGCGARLSQLPHVAGALGRASARVSLFHQDGCVHSYVVAY